MERVDYDPRCNAERSETIEKKAAKKKRRKSKGGKRLPTIGRLSRRREKH